MAAVKETKADEERRAAALELAMKMHPSEPGKVLEAAREIERFLKGEGQ